MNITEIRISRKQSPPLAAVASITIDGCMVIHGLRLYHRKDGSILVTMPSWRKKDGTYEDIVHPADKQTREQLSEKLINAYRDIL